MYKVKKMYLTYDSIEDIVASHFGGHYYGEGYHYWDTDINLFIEPMTVGHMYRVMVCTFE